MSPMAPNGLPSKGSSPGNFLKETVSLTPPTKTEPSKLYVFYTEPAKPNEIRHPPCLIRILYFVDSFPPHY